MSTWSLLFGAIIGGCGDDEAWEASSVRRDCVTLTDVTSFRFSAAANSGWFTASWSAGIEPALGDGW